MLIASTLCANAILVGSNVGIGSGGQSTPKLKGLAKIELDSLRVFERGEVPTISFTVSPTVEQQDSLVTVALTIKCLTDGGLLVISYQSNVTLGAPDWQTRQTVPLPAITDPGIYEVRIIDGSSRLRAFSIAYAPLDINVGPDAQPDFADYWDAALSELAGVDPRFEMTLLPGCSNKQRNVYEISMRSTPDFPGGEPVIIRGYYAEPVRDGVYPTQISFAGTDNGNGTVSPIKASDRPGWCQLAIYTRGQGLNRVKDPESWERYGGDFYSYGLMDSHAHYYRGAYLDCVRAIDFLASRPKVNKFSIFAAGVSQGASFCFAAAALSRRLAGIATAVPGHSDFPSSLQIVSWPANKFKTYLTAHPEVSEDELMTFLSYYDIKNFAPMIECPVLTAIGMQDHTDAPRGGLTAWLLTSTPAEHRTILIDPMLGHAAPDDFRERNLQFFERYIQVCDKPAMPAVETPEFQWRITPGSFSIIGANGLSLSVYATDGTVIHHIEDYTGQSLTVPGPGLYIVRLGTPVPLTVKLPLI